MERNNFVNQIEQILKKLQGNPIITTFETCLNLRNAVGREPTLESFIFFRVASECGVQRLNFDDSDQVLFSKA